MAITTAAQYALLGQESSDLVVDFSTVRLNYITITSSQIRTQLMLVQQFPLF